MSKNKNTAKQTVEYYIMTLFILSLFFGSLFIAGEISGSNEILSHFPDFKWEMFNSWNEIKNKSN